MEKVLAAAAIAADVEKTPEGLLIPGVYDPSPLNAIVQLFALALLRSFS